MDELNQRQIEVIEHFITPENYEKPISTKIYMEMTKTPETTAVSDWNCRKSSEALMHQKHKSTRGKRHGL